MKLQFVKDILADGTADIFLFEEIGGPRGISGAQVAEEMKFLNEVQNVKLIRLHINSPGGTVQDGLSIIGAMRASKAPVDTIAAGIAASIAGIIFLHGRKRSMNDFAKIMIHSPSLPGEENGRFLTDTDKEALAQIQDTLAIQLENNSNKSKKDIIALMEREIWVNADLALTWGLIDEIVDTKREQKTLIGNSIAEIYNSASHILNDYNQLNSKKMQTVTNHLKLNADANEENVLQAIKNIETEISETKTTVSTQEQTIADLETERDALKTRVEELEGESVIKTDLSATEFVENCIESGKFKAEDKDDLIEKAKADLEGFKAIANSINSVAHVDITNNLTTPTIEGANEIGLREMEKSNPAKLLQIRNENPSLFEKMYFDQYGVKLELT